MRTLLVTMINDHEQDTDSEADAHASVTCGCRPGIHLSKTDQILRSGMLSHDYSHSGASNILPSIRVDVLFGLHREYVANGSLEDCHSVS